jgi:hypothetical protein
MPPDYLTNSDYLTQSADPWMEAAGSEQVRDPNVEAARALVVNKTDAWTQNEERRDNNELKLEAGSVETAENCTQAMFDSTDGAGDPNGIWERCIKQTYTTA